MEGKIYHTLVISAALFVLGATMPQPAYAADFSFLPVSGSLTVGNTLTVAVYVSSADKAMNAASGVISFPPDKLEAVSLSKNGSVITLWVEEPSFSNRAGTISFEGIALNPGFTGKNGKIITINFRVKAAGAAPLNFSSASILANDGQGTNITEKLDSAAFSLTKPGNAENTIAPASSPVKKETLMTPTASKNAPQAPLIISPTHPNQTKWYAITNPQFSWRLPADATAAQLLVDKNAIANPTIAYTPAVTTKTITDIADGMWYFHVRIKNQTGWGVTSHFRFQIDTEKPEHFVIEEIPRDDPTDPRVKFILDASDKTSKIDHYEISIDNKKEPWRDDGSRTFQTLPLPPGKHTLSASALDQAGNETTAETEFHIAPLAAPLINDLPATIKNSTPLIINGSSQYPRTQVSLRLRQTPAPHTLQSTKIIATQTQEEEKSYKTETDENGNFMIHITDLPKEGTYQIALELVDSHGAKSVPLEKLITIVNDSPHYAAYINTRSVLLLLLALFCIAIFFHTHHLHGKTALLRRPKKNEHDEEVETLRRMFAHIQREEQEQLALLGAAEAVRQLTAEEKEIRNRLSKNLNAARSYSMKK